MSFVPNVEVAQTFTGSGVWLIATEPTSMTGDAAGTEIPAISCAIPMASAAASSPQRAPHPRESPV